MGSRCNSITLSMGCVMTADIRAAAQRHVNGQVTEYAREWFADGAVWAAARVTPTREQIADAIRGAVKIGWVGPNSQAILRDGGTVHLTPDEAESGADAVLELLQELAKGDHDG